MLRSLRPVCATCPQKSIRYLSAGAIAGLAAVIEILALLGTFIQLDVLDQVAAGDWNGTKR
jgi:hypothetical protein